MKKLLSVVIPMYQEELVANICYKRIKDVMLNISEFDHELIFVNDGSTDNTFQILKDISETDNSVKIINFARNFGHQNAVTAGIFNANGDAIIIIDSDMQDPPELIPTMIEKWKEGFDVVYGTRDKRDGETFFKLFTAKYFYRFLDSISETTIPKDTGDFRLIDRSVANAFKDMPEHNRFIRGMFSWLGFNQTSVLYHRDERVDGNSKYSLKKMLKLAFDGIISFSFAPLKLISILGLTTLLISLIMIILSITLALRGVLIWFFWTSIIACILLTSGIQLILIGIMGEYIGRIYDDSRKRPLYIIKDYINFD